MNPSCPFAKSLNDWKQEVNQRDVDRRKSAAATIGKFFTYVTKIHANLTTYSAKPENSNGTIIFEIDILKTSSPINLKFTLLPLSKPNWHFFSGAVS